MTDDANSHSRAIEQLTQPLDAMHLAQLTAFAFGLPPLYFCREYQLRDDQAIMTECNQRLLKLVSSEEKTLADLNNLLTEKEYFEAYEARLRVAPEAPE